MKIKSKDQNRIFFCYSTCCCCCRLMLVFEWNVCWITYFDLIKDFNINNNEWLCLDVEHDDDDCWSLMVDAKKGWSILFFSWLLKNLGQDCCHCFVTPVIIIILFFFRKLCCNFFSSSSAYRPKSFFVVVVDQKKKFSQI